MLVLVLVLENPDRFAIKFRNLGLILPNGVLLLECYGLG
jgi:hypothetical protein